MNDESGPRAINIDEMVEPDEDEKIMLAQQRRRKLFAALIVLALVGAGIYVACFIHRTEPDNIMIVAQLDDAEGRASYSFGGHPDAIRLEENIRQTLSESGLHLLESTPETLEALAAVSDETQLIAAAAKLGIGHILLASLHTDKVISLDGFESHDYVFQLEIGVIDVDVGAKQSALRSPIRLFLWGKTASDALMTNTDFATKLVKGDLTQALAQMPRLQVFADGAFDLTTDQQVIATRLEPLFRMAAAHERALELRETDRAEAEKEEFVNATQIERTRLGPYLDRDYYVGNAADGRVIVKHDPRHVWWSKGLSYSVYEGGEQLYLTSTDGKQRELFVERYNFFSFPEPSADGTMLAAVLANHGAKSLVSISVPEGVVTPILSDPDEYYSTPQPSPDGARITFLARPERRAASTIEVIDVATQARRKLVEAGVGRVPVWSPDGKYIYTSVESGTHEWIVRVDVESTEMTHILGVESERQVEDDQDRDERIEADDGDDDDDDDDELDPKTSSDFDRVAISHDGKVLYVSEVTLESDYVGRYELATGVYTRMAELEAYKMVASPVADQVAISTTSSSFTAEGDPARGDSEILVLTAGDPEPKVVTLNDVEENLRGWSRDGSAIFTSHQSEDPVDNNYAARLYRYTLD